MGQRESSTVFTSQSITYPADLSEADPNYSKRGTTENILVPDLESYVSASYNNVYVTLGMVGIHYEGYMAENPRHRVHVQYNVYESQDARNNDFSNPLLKDDTVLLDFYDATTGSFDTNIVGIAYDILKNQEGWENMQDV